MNHSWAAYQLAYTLLGPAVLAAAVLFFTLEGPYWWVPVAGLLFIVSWIWFRVRR